MNGSQKQVDFTPLSPVDRSDEQEAALEACLWFDIGEAYWVGKCWFKTITDDYQQIIAFMGW